MVDRGTTGDLARLAVPLAGALEETGDRWRPFRLTDPAGVVVEPVSAFFADLLAAGRSEATIRSYGMDLLRWFRFLWAAGVPWNTAIRAEARDFCRWMQVAGKPARLTPKTAPEHGIILVPGNRQRDGLWMDGTVLENITITQLLAVSRHGLLARRRERVAAMSLIDRYGVVPPSPVRQCRTLSGGNQQKVLLARALSGDTRVLLLHEPTQGVDVGSARDIMRIVVKMAQQGAAVCVCSSDFALIAALSHRVLILTHGQISAELGTGAIDEETIAACAQGLRGGQGDPPPGSPPEPGAARPTAGRRHADADEL